MLLSLNGRERMPRSKLVQKLRRIGRRGRRKRKGQKVKDRRERMGRKIEGQRAVDVYRTHLSRRED
jgi:hypothetical protein